jgi:hypothetical protein
MKPVHDAAQKHQAVNLHGIFYEHDSPGILIENDGCMEGNDG